MHRSRRLMESLESRRLLAGTVTGRAFADFNGDGVYNSTDRAFPALTIYADADNSGSVTAGDVTTTTDVNGSYTLSNVPAGVSVRQVLPTGYVSTTGPAGVAVTTNGSLAGVDFGHFPTSIGVKTATNTITVRLDATGTNLEILVASTPATAGVVDYYTVPQSLISTLSIAGNAGNDTLVIDAVHGYPAAAKTINFNGYGQPSGGGDHVRIDARAAGTGVTFSPQSAQVLNLTVTTTAVEGSAFAGGPGNDTMGVFGATTPLFTGGGGSDTINAQFASYFPTTDLGAGGTDVTLNVGNGSTVNYWVSQHLKALNLTGASASALGTSNPLVLCAGSLSVSADSRVDPGYGAIVLDYAGVSPAATAAGWLARGYAAGAWTGVGVRSSAAAADATKTHGVGLAEAADALGLDGVNTASFMGETVDATTLLLRYTLYGDANLNAAVGFDDFVALQSNFGRPAVGAARGDFDYDGDTDFADFVRLQTNFGRTA